MKLINNSRRYFYSNIPGALSFAFFVRGTFLDLISCGIPLRPLRARIRRIFRPLRKNGMIVIPKT